MNECSELRELLSAYRDGELSAEEARRIEEHLGTCPDCRDALATDERAETALADGQVARTEAEWEALSLRVERAVAKEAEALRPVASVGAWRRFFRSLTPARVAFGSIGTLAAATLIFLLQPWQEELMPDPESTLSRAPSPEATEDEKSPDPEERLRALGYVAGADAPAASAAAPEVVARRDTRPVANQPPLESPLLAKVKLSDPFSKEEQTKPSSPALRSEPEKGIDEFDLVDRYAPRGRVPLDLDRPAGVDLVEEVVVTAGRQSSDAALSSRIAAGPSFAPAAPAGGAQSLQDVSDWVARGEEGRISGVAGFAEKKTMRVQSNEAGAAAAPSDVTILPRALSRANAWISQGKVESGREGLALLTGDFEGNELREEAWTTLLDLDAGVALGTKRTDVILPIALSFDAFLETYPESETAEAIRDQQVRVWAHLASIDPDLFCAAALERAKEWEASLGNWVPFETRMVVARMRDGPCTE
jgi:anti-sigma factor RsiW